MSVKLSHIAFAVTAESYEEVKEKFKKLFKVEPEERYLEHAKLRISTFKLPNASVELMSPASEGSDIDKFLRKRGNALHHIALQVDNVEDEVERLSLEGFELAKREYEGLKGKAAFLHPKSTGGLLLELVEQEY